MKCPQCETQCEPEHEAEPEIGVGVGRYHCPSCGWDEPFGVAAPCPCPSAEVCIGCGKLIARGAPATQWDEGWAHGERCPERPSA